MGEFSIAHLLLFGFIALLFFGPSRIEGLGKSLGRSIRGFKDGMNEIETDAKPVQDKNKELNGQTQTQAQKEKESNKEPHHS